MVGMKYQEMPKQQIRPGAERRLAYTDGLMLAVMDFLDGPKDQPEPLHTHPHEQVSYVAEGEIMFFLEDQQVRLGPGDMFTVPSGKLHTIQVLTERVRLVDCFTPIREDFLK